MPEIWFPNLGIEINQLNNVAFTIFGRNIYWYGILIGIGVLAGLFLALHEAKRTKQDPEVYLDFALYAVVFSVIGARLYYVIFSWDYYGQNVSQILNFREGGLAIYGAVIGGTLTAIVYSKIKKMNFFLLADTVVPSLILGQILGRWGNFFNREAFGDFTNNLFAMRYQLSQVRIGDVSTLTMNHVITENGVDYIQVHPTFLYESLWNICVFLILQYVLRHKKFNGQVAAIYFLGYGLGRFWIEGLRTDQLMLGMFPVSQLLSGVLVIAAAFFLVARNHMAKTMPLEAEGCEKVYEEFPPSATLEIPQASVEELPSEELAEVAQEIPSEELAEDLEHAASEEATDTQNEHNV